MVKLESRYDVIKQRFIKELKVIDYYCITSDIYIYIYIYIFQSTNDIRLITSKNHWKEYLRNLISTQKRLLL